MSRDTTTEYNAELCRAIARDLRVQGFHENDHGAKRSYYRLSRQWERMAAIASTSGPINWRPRVLQR